MPPSSWSLTYELLTRHGVDSDVARSNAINDLRYWELKEVAAILERIRRPSRNFSYFRHAAASEANAGSRPWRSQSSLASWVSPPRVLMEQSARDETALCVDKRGQWALKRAGYVALSHVWVEGLQRDKTHQGLSSAQVDAIFALLQSRDVQAEWVWTDVLVIPDGGTPDNERLTTDIINTMPQVYSRADAVIVIDAMVLQLHARNHIDVAVALACGKWATRVWTFQEIKLASRAQILTATSCFDFGSTVNAIEKLRVQDHLKYNYLWLHLGTMVKDEARGLSIPDLIMNCGTRKSGMDIDYARAFFPVLGLKWKAGMTREQGMQRIYTSYRCHSSRIACFYGAPRLNIMPAWAPLTFNNLEGFVTSPMEWEDRGIRGEWYAVRILKTVHTFVNAARFVFELTVDCPSDTSLQCVCAPNENKEVIQAVQATIERGRSYLLTAQPSTGMLDQEYARIGMLVERAEVNEEDAFEAAVYCAVAIPSRSQLGESKETILLRHWSPMVEDDLYNQVKYILYTQGMDSQPSSALQHESQSTHEPHDSIDDPASAIITTHSPSSPQASRGPADRLLMPPPLPPRRPSQSSPPPLPARPK
ncbi:MAG: hypothetical protein OHK93_007471 [Ramalina farinacea]|uniref:Uncharacterized protein n=1 Tax=Ramalina farinacea TaxID=258253 RepID=A0AA43QLS1_9LECA|nr:hypothetical protein [Ramalina farinacea]